MDFHFSENNKKYIFFPRDNIKEKLTIEPVAERGGSAMSETNPSFCVIEDRDVMGDAFAEVTGVTAELPLVLAFAMAFLVASFTS